MVCLRTISVDTLHKGDTEDDDDDNDDNNNNIFKYFLDYELTTRRQLKFFHIAGWKSQWN